MSLRGKTLIIVSIVVICLLWALYCSVSTIMVGSLTRTETSDANNAVVRARQALEDYGSQLEAVVGSYAHWDWTCSFIRTCSKSYINVNLTPQTLSNLRVNTVIFRDNTGRVVFARNIDTTSGEILPLPPGLEKIISDEKQQIGYGTDKSSYSGIVMLQDGPMLIASSSILNSRGEGSVRGSLIMGRYLDEYEISRLSQLTGLHISLYRIGEKGLYQAALNRSTENEPVIRLSSEEIISGYALLNDIRGIPVLTLKVDMPRQIYHEGMKSLGLLALALVVACVVFAGLGILMHEKLVIAPLRQLSTSIKNIGSSTDFSARISVKGKDEISNLGRAFNRMMEALEHHQVDLRKANSALEDHIDAKVVELEKTNKALIQSEAMSMAILTAMPDLLFCLNEDGIVLGANRDLDEPFSLPSCKFIGKHLRAFLPNRIADMTMHHLRMSLETGNVQSFEASMDLRGQSYYYEIRLSPSGNGEILAICRDITERKTTEEALEESQRILQALMDHTPEALTIVDAPDCRVRICSKNTEHITGFPPETLYGQPALNRGDGWAVLHCDGITPAEYDDLPLTRALVSGEMVVNEEWVFQRTDGAKIPILCNAAPIRDEEGRITSAVLAWRDIRALKVARESLEQAYQHDHHIADVLQRVFVPDVNLDLPGFMIAACYQSALEEAQIGGDFYDVFALDDDHIALVMGDVSGKGLHAAVYTTMAKYMLRAYLHDDHNPSFVLERLNNAMCNYISDDMFVTVFFGILDMKNNKLIYANAGHNEPLIYCSELQRTISLNITGTAIGVVQGINYEESTAELKENSVLLIYTDGITDARSQGRFFGMDGLSEALMEHKHLDENSIAEAVIREATNASDGALSDDAAVIIVKAL